MLVNKRVTGTARTKYFGLPKEEVEIDEVVEVEDTDDAVFVADEALIQAGHYMRFVRWSDGPVIVEVTE